MTSNSQNSVRPVNGDLVVWSAPDRRAHIGIVLYEETGHGGGETGWFRVLTSAAPGRVKKYLAHSSSLEVITPGANA